MSTPVLYRVVADDDGGDEGRHELGWFATRAEAEMLRAELEGESTRRYSDLLRSRGDLDPKDPDQPFYEWSVEEVTAEGRRPDFFIHTDGGIGYR